MSARTSRRLVAAAVVGVGFGVIAAASPAVAADRAFELVTPPGSSARVLPGTGVSTPDGNVVCFDAENAAAGADVNGETAPDGFCSRRTASGWETSWVTGPAVADPKGGLGATVLYVSPDGARAVFATDKGIDPDDPGGPAGSAELAPTTGYMWEGEGRPRWLTPTPEPLQDPAGGRFPLAASEDLRHGLFQSGLRLVPEDGNDAIDVYEWTPDGIRLVSRDASGAAVSGTVPVATAEGNSGRMAQPGAIARDGSRIFFQHVGPLLGGDPGFASVYMRDGDELKLVSPRRGGDAPAPIYFAGASADGEIVYLQTTERLTPEPKEAGTALYRYDVASDALSLVATDPTSVTFRGLSADGSTVVFTTGEPFIGPWELRVARNGAVETLGTLDFPESFTVGDDQFDRRALRIATDGSTVVFSAAGAFAGRPSPGYKQVYRWTPADGVRLISTSPDGGPTSGRAEMGNWSESFGAYPPRAVGLVSTIRFNPLVGRVVSDDGRVYFETADQLVPADVNEYVDVYEWQNGTVRLISPGTQKAAALYHDNSADGNTVFFTTSSRLIPELDRNHGLDLYAARVGGGFPLPTRPAACEGDLCQGPLAPLAPSQQPVTSVFDGPDDLPDPAPKVPRHSLLKLTAKQRGAFARSGRAVLRVRANVNGVVTATARARLGRRTTPIARSTAAVRSGRIVRLPLVLSRRAQAALRARRTLRVVITVSYSESERSLRQVVVLRG